MKNTGFTLAELLIALAILGVIATFTIPKVLNSQQDSAWNSAAKEAVAAISNAYTNLQLTDGVSSNTRLNDLSPYLNYVSVITNTTLNWEIGQPAALDCSLATITCLKLHNDGAFWWHNNCFFNGTSNLNMLFFRFDPDGEFQDNTVNPGTSSVSFYLYYNGLIRTRSTITPGSTNNCATSNPGNIDPPWFSWS